MFTGNVLLVMAAASRKITARRLLRNWGIVLVAIHRSDRHRLPDLPYWAVRHDGRAGWQAGAGHSRT